MDEWFVRVPAVMLSVVFCALALATTISDFAWWRVVVHGAGCAFVVWWLVRVWWLAGDKP